MEKELLFAKTLEEVRKLAKEQNNCVSKEQVEDAFKELNLDETQMDMVYDYLKNHKVGIGEPVNMDDYLTEEEKNYLQTYLDELQELEKVSQGQKEAITLSAMAGDGDAQGKLIELYLPEVVDFAKLYTGQGVFLEDLIGEGNVDLTMGVQMLGCLEAASEAPGMLGNMIMEAMETYISENAEESKKDNKIAQRVNKVADAARELAESLGKKVTIEELAEETGFSLQTILTAVRMSGNKIEDLESGEEG